MLFYSVCASYISCGDADGKVYVWDWKSTKLYSKFKAHDDVCISVLWHPHETSKMATAGWDGVIKYWDWDIGLHSWNTGTERSVLDYWDWDMSLGMLGLRCSLSWNAGTEILVLEYWDGDIGLGILGRDVCLGILGLRYVYRNTGTEMSVLDYWDWDVCLGILGLRGLSCKDRHLHPSIPRQRTSQSRSNNWQHSKRVSLSPVLHRQCKSADAQTPVHWFNVKGQEAAGFGSSSQWPTLSMSVGLCCPCAVVQATGYHWPELSQVSFLLRQQFGRHKNVFVATDTCLLWQNTSFVATKVCLSRQMFCRNKSMLDATNVLSWQIFVATNTILSQQNLCHGKLTFCCDKHMFVMTKHVFCCDKSILSWQKFCHSKHTFVVTNFCHAKNNTCGRSRWW